MRNTLIILAVLLSNAASAQEIMMKNYRSEDGLPSNETFHVMQDSKGYIWMGTNLGVSRFDGYSFKNFDNHDGVAGNTILDIYEDYKGRIWFISLTARLSYYYQDSVYQWEHNDKLISSLERSPVPLKRSFYVDTADNIYYSIRPLGIFKISKEGDITKWQGWPDNKNYVIDLGEKTLVSNLRKSAPEIDLYFNESLEKKIKLPTLKDASRGLTLVHKSQDNDYFLTNTNSVIRLHNNQSEIVYHNDEGYIIDFITEKDNTPWLSFTKHGVIKYSDLTFSTVTQHLLKDHSVSTVFKDKDDGYWFTTLSNGVYYAPNLSIRSLSDSFLAPDNSNIADVLKTNDNLLLFSRNNQMHVATTDNNNRIKKNRTYNISNSSYNLLNSVSKYNDLLYVGGNIHLHKVSGHNNYKFTKTPIKIESTSNVVTSGIKSIYLSPEGKLFLGNAASFLKEIGWKKDTLLVERISRFRTSCIVPDPDNKHLWLGSLYGLYQYNVDKNHLIYHGDLSNDLQNRISDIVVIDSSTIAFGSRGNGVVIYNHHKKESTVLNKADGLNSHYITSLLLKDSLLWAGTNQGINIICLKNTNTPIRQITRSSGLPDNHINKIRIFDSVIFVATKKGVSYFNPDIIKKDTTSLPVYIQKITGGYSHNKTDQPIKVPYPKNTLGFHYSPLVYNHDKKLQYRYRIKGLNETWQYTTNNEVFFPYIPYGDYVFEIAVKNKVGLWSKEATAVPFTIEKPYWKSTWFFIIAGIVLLLFVLVITMLIIRNRKIKEEAQQSISKYRQQALSNQMNPHFLFNSLNSIHRFLLENKSAFASKYLSKFAKLMRLFLENSSKEMVTIKKELEIIELYLELENLRMKNAFDYRIHMPPSADLSNMLIPAMIIQPVVENAILHGIRYLQNTRGLIEISFTIKDDLLQIAVYDNGVGMAKASELEHKSMHTSRGSAIVRKRIRLLNQLNYSNITLDYLDLQKEGTPMQGTKVVFNNIPIIKQDDKNRDN
ncbi:MAG: histidine kinase [Bacteroidales bacterium]|nr:histidine kinase [Bacteroidales bacterium]